MHAFLLIGQSNMAGRGYLQEAMPIDTSRLYTLRNGRWQKLFRPIHPDRKFSGVCLAESFAEAYAKKHDVDVGLICCADGGTSLNQWQPGSVLFDNAVFQAKLAMRSATLAGILWHQGEADCPQPLCDTYETRFLPILSAFRKELGDVPFLVGGLGDFLKDCQLDHTLKNYPRINLALKQIVSSQPFTGFVSAEGLSANPDQLHFCAASLYEFGLRYFDAFEKIGVFPSADNAPTQELKPMEYL